MSGRKLVSFDWALKRLLRHKANFGIIEGFLSELLNDDIKIRQILESESNRDHKHARANRVDMMVQNSRNELIIVEIQHEAEYDYLLRMLFGVSKALVEYIKMGEPYTQIKKVISINLVYFDLGQGEDYVYRGKTEFTGLNKHDILKLDSIQAQLYGTEKISDIYPEYYILKINQFDDIARNTIDEWIYFFKNEKIEDDFTAKGLKEAKKELDIMKLSDKERKAYEAYLEDMRYEASMFESSYKVGELKGIEKGVEIGMEKGSKDKAIEMARESLKEGLAVELVSKLTGLSIEDINKIESLS